MSVPMLTIREVKQLSNVFVVFCILQVACIILTARMSARMSKRIFLLNGDQKFLKFCGHPTYST